MGLLLCAAPVVGCAVAGSYAGMPVQFAEPCDGTIPAEVEAHGGGLDNNGVPVIESFAKAFPVNREVCQL